MPCSYRRFTSSRLVGLDGGRMRVSRFIGLTVGFVVACLTVSVLTLSAFAVTTTPLGATAENYKCATSYEWIQTASASAIYAAPRKGTLVHWSTNGGEVGGTMQFEV